VAYLVRFLLLGLLIVLVARSFWRFVGSIVEGASSTPGARSRPPERSVPMVRDPVCGTFVVPATALTVNVEGRVTCFCSEKCRQAFQAGAMHRTASSR
jgi:YHS domain-containing protein